MTLAHAISGLLDAAASLSAAAENLTTATDNLKASLANYVNEPGATLADPEVEQPAPAINEDQIDYLEVSQAAVALSKVGGRDAILQLLSSLDVANLKELPAARYGEAMARIDEIKRSVKVAA